MEPATGVTDRLVERLSQARSLAILTGSGVSRESGIPTFRGKDGFWEKHRVEELATWQAFEAHPELVWRWYDYRRQLVAEAQPNAAHFAIARLEAGFESFVLVTQNVDGLHRRAGSSEPLELHGNIWRARCTREHTTVDLPDCPLMQLPPLCSKCGALLRPDVVWFGEPLPPDAYERAYDAATNCDAMLVVGTSAMVRPAASLPLVAKHNGAAVVEVNLGFTPISALIDATLMGRAGDILPELTDRILKLTGARSTGATSRARGGRV